MDVKNLSSLQFEGSICQFMGVDEVIEATSEGYTLRCALKPSAEYQGAYVAEVWAFDPATEKDELQGIMAVLPDTATGTIHILRGKTLDELRHEIEKTVGKNVYKKLLMEDQPNAPAVSAETDNKITLTVERNGSLH
jgi:hypothetical protein